METCLIQKKGCVCGGNDNRMLFLWFYLSLQLRDSDREGDCKMKHKGKGPSLFFKRWFEINADNTLGRTVSFTGFQ